MELLPEVREVLEACGWSEERLIDTAEFQQVVEAAGYCWHAAGAYFLSRFGGLATRAPFTGEPVRFDPAVVIRYDYPENIVAASEQVGSLLCPVGVIGYTELLIDDEGAMYSEHCGCMRFLGHTPEDSLNALLAREMPPWSVVSEHGWSKPVRSA